MNTKRRKEIEELKGNIEKLQEQLDEAQKKTENLKIEEQEYFDDLSEAAQAAEKGEKAEAAIETLDNISIELESASDILGNAVNRFAEIE